MNAFYFHSTPSGACPLSLADCRRGAPRLRFGPGIIVSVRGLLGRLFAAAVVDDAGGAGSNAEIRALRRMAVGQAATGAIGTDGTGTCSISGNEGCNERGDDDVKAAIRILRRRSAPRSGGVPRGA